MRASTFSVSNFAPIACEAGTASTIAVGAGTGIMGTMVDWVPVGVGAAGVTGANGAGTGAGAAFSTTNGVFAGVGLTEGGISPRGEGALEEFTGTAVPACPDAGDGLTVFEFSEAVVRDVLGAISVSPGAAEACLEGTMAVSAEGVPV